MRLGAEFFENLTIEKVDVIVEEWDGKGERSRYC